MNTTLVSFGADRGLVALGGIALGVAVLGAFLLSTYGIDLSEGRRVVAAPPPAAAAPARAARMEAPPASAGPRAEAMPTAPAKPAAGEARAAPRNPHAVPRPPAALPPVEGRAGAAQAAVAGFTHFRVGDRNVRRILVDGDRVWVGTSGGLIRYSPATDAYRLYDQRSGLRSNVVVFVGRLGASIAVGTLGGGLSLLDPASGNWEHFGTAEGLGDTSVHDLLRTSNGDVWVATRAGVSRVAGGALRNRESWAHFTVASTGGGLPSDRVYALAEGRDGDVWMATEAGVAAHRDGRWRQWDLGAAKPDAARPASAGHDRERAPGRNLAVAIASDRTGVVWVGTLGGGLLRFDGAGWRRYAAAEGLPGDNVLMLHRDAKNRLWVGTDNGLARLHDGQFSVMTTREGLFSNAVFAMASAPEALWIGSYGAVARITGSH
jgi:ligand-binding sensor domain-containing protein